MKTEKEVWVLGATNQNADKTIKWHSQFPNFSEPDVIIINLQSLTLNVLEHIDKDKFRNARQQIFDKFINGGSLIFITAQYAEEKSGYYSNFFLSPIVWETQDVVGG